MIHSAKTYIGKILKEDAEFLEPDGWYVLVHVTTLEEGKTLAESLE